MTTSLLLLEDLSNFVTTLLYIYVSYALPGMLGLVNIVLSVTRATRRVVRTRRIIDRRPAPQMEEPAPGQQNRGR